MATMKDKMFITSVPCVFRKVNGKVEWFLVKTDIDKDWELPSALAKATESSVRTSIRTLLENAGMNAKVLEEISRSGGAARINGKIASQRIIYYLMLYKDGKQTLGYVETDWFSPAVAVKKLKTKRDIQVLKDAKKLIDEVEQKRGKPYRDSKMK